MQGGYVSLPTYPVTKDFIDEPISRSYERSKIGSAVLSDGKSWSKKVPADSVAFLLK